MRASRSPPPAASAATSHSAAIETASRSSRRLVTGSPSARTAIQLRRPRAVDGAEVDARAGPGLRGDHARDDVGLLHVPPDEVDERGRALRPAPCRQNRVDVLDRRPRAVRAARPVVRPRGGDAVASARTPAGAGSSSPVSRTTAGTSSTSRPGTGLVAAELLRRGHRGHRRSIRAPRCSPSRARRFGGPRRAGRERPAESLPFADASFDHLTVTYLLRYVDDPGATLAELARVVRPGGIVASLEFGVPRGGGAAALGAVRASRAAARGQSPAVGLGRGGRLPRWLDPLVLGAVPDHAPGRALARSGHARTSARGGSRSAGGS